MTKKHFNRIAHALQQAKPVSTFDEGAMESWRDLCRDIASICADSNPNFDRQRFMTACEGN